MYTTNVDPPMHIGQGPTCAISSGNNWFVKIFKNKNCVVLHVTNCTTCTNRSGQALFAYSKDRLSQNAVHEKMDYDNHHY